MIKKAYVQTIALTVLLSGSSLPHAQNTDLAASPVAPTQTVPTGAVPNHEGLNATVWVQSAAEAKIAARQAYRLATRQLDAALRDRNWTAATEQTTPFKKLPPAIILDLDETVLDNSYYSARMVRDNDVYTGPTWAQWIAQADATAIPGAIPFLQEANRRGVRIYYVSNRSAPEEAATRENLRRLGCPIQGPEDHVLLSGERPDWTSDKTSRRRFVAQNHRVLLLLGDDFNDFVPAARLTVQQRVDLLEKYAPYWGERWILLSNPLYGSWENTIYGYNYDLSRDETLRLKYGALDFREPASPNSLIPTPPTATR